MEHTVARKRQRTIEGVFTQSPEQARVQELVETRVNTPVVLTAPKHQVVAYGSRPPLPETFEVRVARVLDEKLAPLYERLATIESRQATALAQTKMFAKDVINTREAILRAAAIHVQETQETRRVALDVVAIGKPLAKRALELEAEKMKKAQVFSAGQTFLQVLWDNRAIFAGGLFTVATFFCIASMVFYYTNH